MEPILYSYLTCIDWLQIADGVSHSTILIGGM